RKAVKKVSGDCFFSESHRIEKSRRASDILPVSQIPTVSKDIKEIRVDQNLANNFVGYDDKSSYKDSDTLLVHSSIEKAKNLDSSSQSGSFNYLEKDGVGLESGEKGSNGTINMYQPSSHPISVSSPLSGLPEFSRLGWGHWFTLRDLETATSRFSKDNIIGEGGYGVVYRGHLINGIPVAVKRLLNNL
ncbi:unnamed protein product, partial [Ilex paraguariensis]